MAIFSKSEKVKMFEAFSGIGCQKMALERVTDNFEIVGISEIDPHSLRSYMIMHGNTENYGSITDVDEIPETDIFTYSFPCQDISLAGKMKGIEKDTRSGLLYEALRVIKKNKPKVCIAENVKNLVSNRFIDKFNDLLEELDELGYNSYWKVLNAVNYGIPQKREREYLLCLLEKI